MTTSENGYSLIRKSEGLRLDAYKDAARGIWTIGYGHTGGVLFGQTITEEGAEDLLRQDTVHCEDAVNALVKVTITQNQFDALVDFVFNLGRYDLQSSTLLRLLNQSEYEAAAEQFLRWDKGLVNGQYVSLPGLTARRQAEKELFLEV